MMLGRVSGWGWVRVWVKLVGWFINIIIKLLKYIVIVKISKYL